MAKTKLKRTVNHEVKPIETIEMEGPGGLVVVGKHEQAAYENRGYKVYEAPEVKPLEKFTKDELKAKAEELGIEIPDKATKDDLFALVSAKLAE